MVVEKYFLLQSQLRQQQETLDRLSTLRARIEGVINSNISLVAGFASVIAASPNIDQHIFDQIGEQVISQSQIIRNISGAPGMVISLVYPLKGNEAAIGLNYNTHPTQRAAALKVVETGKLVLAGPLPLQQGGIGFIARILVKTKLNYNNGEDEIWGLLSSVFDSEKLYLEAGLLNENMDIQIALKGKDAMGEKGKQFFGKPSLYENSPVTTEINLPYGSWQLAAIPKQGWISKPYYTLPIRALSLFIALLVSSLIFLKFRSNEEHRQHKHQLQESNHRFTSVLDGMNSLIYVSDMESYELLYANPKAKELFGQDIVGKKCWESFQFESQGPCDFCTNKHLLDEKGDPLPTYRWEKQNSITGIWYQCEDQAIPWNNGQMVRLELATDITQMKHNENQLREAHDNLESIAYFDPLTNLPNRRQFSESFNESVKSIKNTSNQLAICYLDLDGFKTINDTFGHNTGDELLIQSANRLERAIRVSDCIARWGGDEFAFILKIRPSDNSSVLLTRILENVTDSYKLKKTETTISASIGVSIYPDDGTELDILLRQADQAMYKAKQKGKKQFCFFDTLQDHLIHKKSDQLNVISNAISNNEMVLYFQPKVSTTDQIVFGVEVLVRWKHPEKGILPPLEFLPTIHGTEVQSQLDLWVISSAIRQAVKWEQENINLSVSINVSPYTLQQTNFTSLLKGIIGTTPLTENLIELEILESEVADFHKIAQVIQDLKDKNINFALDDYGTGYSSLTYLRQLPVHTLKIDQSFIRNMLVDENDLNIVEGVIGLARAFNKEIIAEGVESMEHGIQLSNMGCHNLQGYFIAKPMPIAKLLPWLEKYQFPQEWIQINSDI